MSPIAFLLVIFGCTLSEDASLLFAYVQQLLDAGILLLKSLVLLSIWSLPLKLLLHPEPNDLVVRPLLDQFFILFIISPIHRLQVLQDIRFIKVLLQVGGQGLVLLFIELAHHVVADQHLPVCALLFTL